MAPRRESSTPLVLKLLVMFLAGMVGYIWFGVVDDPPDNLVSVKATLVSFAPRTEVASLEDGFEVERQVGPRAVIRINNQTYSGEGNEWLGEKHPGDQVRALVRIGRLSHKLLKVVYVYAE